MQNLDGEYLSGRGHFGTGDIKNENSKISCMDRRYIKLIQDKP
jgi:hypothetical protein